MKRDDLIASARRMATNETNNPGATRDDYGVALLLALEQMPHMSARHVRLVADAIYAAHQLGQLNARASQ